MGGRAGVMGMICLNMIIERTIASYLVEPGSFVSVARPLRKLTMLVCLGIIISAAWTYTDLQIENNKLLTDLHSQLDMLKRSQSQQESNRQREQILYLSSLERAVAIRVPRFQKQPGTRLRRRLKWFEE